MAVGDPINYSYTQSTSGAGSRTLSPPSGEIWKIQIITEFDSDVYITGPNVDGGTTSVRVGTVPPADFGEPQPLYINSDHQLNIELDAGSTVTINGVVVKDSGTTKGVLDCVFLGYEDDFSTGVSFSPSTGVWKSSYITGTNNGDNIDVDGPNVESSDYYISQTGRYMSYWFDSSNTVSISGTGTAGINLVRVE